jgi:DNA-binding response OmpR family regulator
MNPHILVIEDEQSLSQALCDNLALSGYNVEAAYDGEEALEKARKKTPSLILTDLLMPKIDGFDFITIVKKDTKLKHVPIIVLSNLDGLEAKARVHAMGIEHYLIKSETSILKIIHLIRDCLPSAHEKVADLTN